MKWVRERFVLEIHGVKNCITYRYYLLSAGRTGKYLIAGTKVVHAESAYLYQLSYMKEGMWIVDVSYRE